MDLNQCREVNELPAHYNQENDLKKLEKQILQLNALNKISFDLTETTDLEVLLNKIIKYAAEIVEGEAASILLLDKVKRE